MIDGATIMDDVIDDGSEKEDKSGFVTKVIDGQRVTFVNGYELTATNWFMSDAEYDQMTKELEEEENRNKKP